MTTYVYQTIPTDGCAPQTFEFRQSIKDAPLTHHPQTGEPIRRVISGGLGYLAKPSGASPAPSAGGHCHGPSCGCSHG
jgi:predicted nucleic acid-binding Zn ribbon protein